MGWVGCLESRIRNHGSLSGAARQQRPCRIVPGLQDFRDLVPVEKGCLSLGSCIQDPR